MRRMRLLGWGVILLVVAVMVGGAVSTPNVIATGSEAKCQEWANDGQKAVVLIDRGMQTVATFQEMISTMDESIGQAKLDERRQALDHGTKAVQMEQKILMQIREETQQNLRRYCQ